LVRPDIKKWFGRGNYFCYCIPVREVIKLLWLATFINVICWTLDFLKTADYKEGEGYKKFVEYYITQLVIIVTVFTQFVLFGMYFWHDTRASRKRLPPAVLLNLVWGTGNTALLETRYLAFLENYCAHRGCEEMYEEAYQGLLGDAKAAF